MSIQNNQIELNHQIFKYIVASFITKSSLDLVDNIVDIFIIPIIDTDKGIQNYKFKKIHAGNILINLFKISIYSLLIYFTIKYLL